MIYDKRRERRESLGNWYWKINRTVFCQCKSFIDWVAEPWRNLYDCRDWTIMEFDMWEWAMFISQQSHPSFFFSFFLDKKVLIFFFFHIYFGLKTGDYIIILNRNRRAVFSFPCSVCLNKNIFLKMSNFLKCIFCKIISFIYLFFMFGNYLKWVDK